MDGESKILRIVPGDMGRGTAHRTAGTKVFCGEQEVRGVTRIDLVADAEDGIWRAVIHCMPELMELRAESVYKRASLWAKVKHRLSAWFASLPYVDYPR